MLHIIRQLFAPLSLFVGFAVGLSFPCLSVAQPLVRPLVMGMLFLVFLQLNWQQLRLRLSNFLIVIANLCIPIFYYSVFSFFGYPTLALGAFFAGIAPTGTAAPSVLSFLKQNVEYGVTSFVMTTFVITMTLPIILPFLMPASPHPVDFWTIFAKIAASTCTLVFIPVILSLIYRAIYAPINHILPKFYRAVSFGMWVCCITIMLSNASNTIQTKAANQSNWFIPVCFMIALLVCVTNFTIGFFLSRQFPHEASQTLGQKNIAVPVVLAAAYCDPLTTIIPLLYILCHNTWNSYQMIRLSIKENQNPD